MKKWRLVPGAGAVWMVALSVGACSGGVSAEEARRDLAAGCVERVSATGYLMQEWIRSGCQDLYYDHLSDYQVVARFESDDEPDADYELAAAVLHCLESRRLAVNGGTRSAEEECGPLPPVESTGGNGRWGDPGPEPFDPGGYEPDRDYG